MSLQAEATQPGIAPAPVQTPAPSFTGIGICVGVRGKLAGNPIVRDSSDGHHGVLEVLIHQRIEHHPHALPVFAKLKLPDQGSYMANVEHARRAAYGLAQAPEVMVLGVGIETGTQHGAPVLRVLQCIAITPLITEQQQPAEEPAAP